MTTPDRLRPGAITAAAPCRRSAGTFRSWRSAGRAAVVVMAGVLLVLQGCGLPSRTEPRYAGPAQSAAPAQDETKPPTPDDATTATQLVSLFLQASVGSNADTDGDPPNQENRDRLRQFMTESMALKWKPPAGLIVIRDQEIHQTDLGGGRWSVKIDINQVGTLNENGTFTAKPGVQDPATFEVETNPDGQLRIDSAPNLLLLSDTGLKSWYDWQPIYFWESGSSDHPKLVPDMRYLPTSRTLTPTRRVNEVLHWLQLGPSQLLQGGVVAPLSTDFQFKDNPVIDAQGVKVNLDGNAAKRNAQELTRLARQIRWSLDRHPLVRLTIENQPYPVDSDSGFTADNAAFLQATTIPTPEKFIVSGNAVRAVTVPPSGETPLFVAGPSNTQVNSAAIDRQLSRAALVRKVEGPAKNEQELWVSTPDVPLANPPVYKATGIRAARTMSRPAWMTYPTKRVLVAADGILYAGIDDASLTLGKVITPQGTGAITAFAVSPEGHRIAFIADGSLKVASLTVDGKQLSMGTTTQPVTTTLGSNEGVSWLTETVLVVGGKPSTAPPSGPPYSVVAITVDGASEIPLPVGAREPSQLDVTAVVAQFGSPLDMSTLSWAQMPVSVMVQVNGQAREVFRNSIDPIGPASPPVNPTAPFYPD